MKNFSLDKLLKSNLIHGIDNKKTLLALKNSPNPVAWLIANKHVVVKNFYLKLAEIYDIEFIDEIPQSISPSHSIAQQVPPNILVKNRLFVFSKNKNLVIVTSNPFVGTEILDEILSYTKFEKYTLAIANPAAISEALSLNFYSDFVISSEERIHILHPEKSTKTYSTLIVPKIFPIGFFIFTAIMILIYPSQTLTFIFIVLNVLYFLINPYKIYIFFRSFTPKKNLEVNQLEIEKLTYKELPIYTILLPLRNEDQIVDQLIVNIKKIIYPQDKLDIKFIVDIGDDKTIKALVKNGVGDISADASLENQMIEMIKVPPSTIATKPRACDYALGYARGTYTVIYDAEDKPDADQLLKAYVGFMKSSIDTICIQARLTYYNSRQNLLTRLFTLEYGFWFNHFLVGLKEAESPIPLGGTSNHFVTDILKKIGTWDPYNVTEDADLGLRIARYNYKTQVIDSYTQEEANSKLFNWIRQRTRWQKGFLVTFLVHTSKPLKLIKELGFGNFLLSLLNFGGNFFLPLFNLLLWLVFFITIIPHQNILSLQVTIPLRLIALFNLLIGNGAYLFVHSLTALKNKRYDLLLAVPFLSIYWMLISVATYRAAWQFMRNPYYWEKTKHGLIKK